MNTVTTPQAAIKLFTADAKKLNLHPSPEVVKRTVNNAVKDMQHLKPSTPMPESFAVLRRVGRLLKAPAYKAALTYSMWVVFKGVLLNDRLRGRMQKKVNLLRDNSVLRSGETAGSRANSIQQLKYKIVMKAIVMLWKLNFISLGLRLLIGPSGKKRTKKTKGTKNQL